MYGFPRVIDIGWYIWAKVIMRKYIFAALENYAQRFFGMKVSQLYFVVRILFDAKRRDLYASVTPEIVLYDFPRSGRPPS